MQYFTIQAPSHREALEKVRRQYGDQARILNHKAISLGGFLGLFAREGIEVSGYVAAETHRRKSPDLEEEKKKFLATVKSEQTLQHMLKEIQALKEKLDDRGNPAARGETHPSMARLESLLADNEFTPVYRAAVIDHLRRSLSLEELDDWEKVQDAASQWIASTIDIYVERSERKPLVFVLVGPTGVGKTTTVAKLAALYGVGARRPLDVRIVTIDNYRIGAKQQIETYGEIMDIPVFCAQSTEELRKCVALHEESDIIFVDTIGKSPRDFMKLAEMRKLLEGVRAEARIHLAISATTKSMDIVEIMQQFEPFKYESVIVTKLDETTRLGNIVSVLHERRKPVSFLTDGQSVPQDISRATVGGFLARIQGLRVKRELLENQTGGEKSVME